MHATVTRGITRSAYVALVSRPSAAQGMEHVWGHINHAGWAPPDGELKGVEYRSIVGELPALLQLEANAAVARVAADPGVAHRPPHVTLRQWMENLVGMELAPREETEVFLALYERARFRMRGKGIAEGEFRALMKGLKAVLGGMGAAVDARGATGYAHIPGTDGGEEGHDGYPASIRVEDESYARFRRAAGYGRYETSLSTEYGYTPERVDTGDTSYHPNVAEGTSTMIMPPMGRTRTTSSMSGVPRIRDISGDGGGQVIELTEMRRRQLGARLSTGTFG